PPSLSKTDSRTWTTTGTSPPSSASSAEAGRGSRLTSALSSLVRAHSSLRLRPRRLPPGGGVVSFVPTPVLRRRADKTVGRSRPAKRGRNSPRPIRMPALPSARQGRAPMHTCASRRTDQRLPRSRLAGLALLSLAVLAVYAALSAGAPRIASAADTP